MRTVPVKGLRNIPSKPLGVIQECGYIGDKESDSRTDPLSVQGTCVRLIGANGIAPLSNKDRTKIQGRIQDAPL